MCCGVRHSYFIVDMLSKKDTDMQEAIQYVIESIEEGHRHHMMTSSNGNIFRVTGPLCGEFTGPRRIPLTKASDAELWCFLWSAPE